MTRQKKNNIINQWGCKKLISSTTRFGQHKESCIDQIITNSEAVLATGVADINLSDHQLVFVQRKISKMPTKKITFHGRSHRNYDTDLFTSELVEQDWTEFFANENPNDLWEIMLSRIINIADEMCPVKKFNIKKYRDPWITPEMVAVANKVLIFSKSY